MTKDELEFMKQVLSNASETTCDYLVNIGFRKYPNLETKIFVMDRCIWSVIREINKIIKIQNHRNKLKEGED